MPVHTSPTQDCRGLWCAIVDCSVPSHEYANLFEGHPSEFPYPTLHLTFTALSMSCTLTSLTLADEMSKPKRVGSPGCEFRAVANLHVCFISTGIQYGFSVDLQ